MDFGLKKMKVMEDKYKSIIRDLGIDLSDLSFPISKEYKKAVEFNDPLIQKCMDHMVLKLIESLYRIKDHNNQDFIYYTKKLNQREISFWGERFEIYMYSQLIQKNEIKNFRRGVQHTEADFVFNFRGHSIEVETTSANFQDNSEKTDGIYKIKNAINKKERKPYASTNCVLIIDITNLNFHRKILNNFSVTISSIIESLSSKYGAVLFLYSYHVNGREDLNYVSDVYDWRHAKITQELDEFLKFMTGEVPQEEGDKIFLTRM